MLRVAQHSPAYLLPRPSRSLCVKVVNRESRVGSKPIPVPKGTTVKVDGLTIRAKVGLELPRQEKDPFFWRPPGPADRWQGSVACRGPWARASTSSRPW